MAQIVVHAVLRALGSRPGIRPLLLEHSDQQVAVALDELRRGGLVQGLELTPKGKQLLEDLSK
jgi:hypothetical protein